MAAWVRCRVERRLADGIELGFAVGLSDGMSDGMALGFAVGLSDGMALGFTVGLTTVWHWAWRMA